MEPSSAPLEIPDGCEEGIVFTTTCGSSTRGDRVGGKDKDFETMQ